jgi:hypothetical protein
MSGKPKYGETLGQFIDRTICNEPEKLARYAEFYVGPHFSSDRFLEVCHVLSLVLPTGVDLGKREDT